MMFYVLNKIKWLLLLLGFLQVLYPGQIFLCAQLSPQFICIALPFREMIMIIFFFFQESFGVVVNRVLPLKRVPPLVEYPKLTKPFSANSPLGGGWVDQGTDLP